MKKQMNYDANVAVAMNPLAAEIASAFNIDASEMTGVFLATQLEQVIQAGYENEIPLHKIFRHLPLPNQPLDSLAETLSFIMFDGVGMARIVDNYSDDYPTIEVHGKKHRAEVHEIGNAYYFSDQELALAARNNVPLDSIKPTVARNAIDNKLAEIAMYGDNQRGIFGMTNHPNIPTTILPSGLNWLSPNITPQQLLDDFTALYNSVVIQSKELHEPNKVLMPLSHLSKLRDTTFPNSDKSVLTRIQENYPNLEIDSMTGLQAQGENVGRVLIGEFESLNFFHAITMFFTQHRPVLELRKVKTPCSARTAGFVLRKPLSLAVAIV